MHSTLLLEVVLFVYALDKSKETECEASSCFLMNKYLSIYAYNLCNKSLASPVVKR